MILFDYFFWLSPVFMIISGVLLAHTIIFIRQRYVIYAVVLFLAFLFDLTGISFISDIADKVLLLTATAIITEFYWRIFCLNRNRLLRSVSIMIGIGLFLLSFNSWIFSGANNANLKSEILSRYQIKDKTYIIKEFKNPEDGYARTFSLNKCLKHFPLEKFLKSYKIPDGYENAEFKFQWVLRKNILCVDIIGDKDQLWTLDEEP